MTDSIDENVLRELQDIMEEDFPLLLETYLSESEQQYGKVVSSWTEGDLDGLHRSAHALKGSCANVGAVLSAELCQLLERAAVSKETDQLSSTIEALQQELSVVRDDLSTRLT